MKKPIKITPDEKAELFTADEIAKLVEVDDYLWIEFRHGKQTFELLEDETFPLRVGYVHGFGFDLCAPHGAIPCYYSDYNRTWRVWDKCPVWDNSELWKDERK